MPNMAVCFWPVKVAGALVLAHAGNVYFWWGRSRMRYLIFILLLQAPFSIAWECPHSHLSAEKKLEYIWANSKEVVVAVVQSGRLSGENGGYYEYDLGVSHALKSEHPDTIKIQGDWSIQLTIGQQYVFFKNGNKLDFCDLVLPFEFQWLEREDVPRQREYVEKILSLSGYRYEP